MHYEYPTLLERIQSLFIDTLAIILLLFALVSWLDHYPTLPDGIRVLFFVLVIGLYEPLCTALGCTAGNYIKGIRVRKVANPAQRIPLHLAIVRYGVKMALGWISFVTIHSNPERRALHDLASGSVMIRK